MVVAFGTWLERQGFLAGDSGQHDAEGVGHGQPHRRQYEGRLFLDVLVDTGTDYSICGHGLNLQIDEPLCSPVMGVYQT